MNTSEKKERGFVRNAFQNVGLYPLRKMIG